MSTPTVRVASDEFSTRCSSTLTSIALDRRLLSDDRDTALHSNPDLCPRLILASGRWEVVNPGRRLLRVVPWTGMPLHPDGGGGAVRYGEAELAMGGDLAVTVSDIAPIGPAVRRRFELMDGDWLIGVRAQRWWFVRLQVLGQASRLPVHPDLPSTEDEPVAQQQWERPLREGHLQRVSTYLQGETTLSHKRRVRRAVLLAALYREYLTDVKGPAERPQQELMDALDLNGSALNSLRESIAEHAWGSRAVNDVRRYLLAHALLDVADVHLADDLAADVQARGATDWMPDMRHYARDRDRLREENGD